MSDILDQVDQGEDFFDDADLANPEPLPVGVRYIGVATVDGKMAEIGNFRKIEGKLAEALAKKGDFRAELPQITVNITALGLAGQPKGFPEDKNYLRSTKQDYMVGKPDKIGRNALARLVRDAAGMSDDELKATPLREAAKKLDKCFLTFEVVHVEGKQGGKFQNPVKIKAATAEEVALVA